MRSKIKRWPLYVVGTIFCCVIFAYGTGQLRFPGRNLHQFRSIEATIESELPLGSTISQTKVWLQDRSLHHYGITTGKNLEFDSAVTRSQYRPDELSVVIVIRIPDTQRSFMTTWDKYIVLFFGKKKKLIKYSIHEEGHSL